MPEVETPRAAVELFEQAVDQAERYAQILATQGLEWGLIGPGEVERLWERHILNSLALESQIPRGSFVVDVGSGAGLPGIPLALKRPDLKITLLEALLRRTNFLEHVVAELRLEDRVRVIRGRAEEHRERYDAVISRAVAPMPRLIEWCAPLLARGGRIVALKGATVTGELEEAAGLLRRHRLECTVREVRVHQGADPTYVVVCK